MLFKDLMKYAKQWQEGTKAKQPSMNIRLSKGYQEYMKWKYEMLCERFNDFNINK